MAQESNPKRAKSYRDRAEAELRSARSAMKTVRESDDADAAQIAALHFEHANALALLDLADAMRHGSSATEA